MLRNRGTPTNAGGGGAAANLPSHQGYGGYSGGSNGYGGQNNGGGYAGYNGNGSQSDLGYGGAPEPLSSPKQRRRSSYSASSTISAPWKNPVLVLGSLTLIFLFTTLYYRSSGGDGGQTLQQIRDQLGMKDVNEVLEYVQDLKARVGKSRTEVDQAKREAQRKYSTQISDLERENRALQQQLKDGSGSIGTEVEVRDDAWKAQVQSLLRFTRQESKRAVIDK